MEADVEEVFALYGEAFAAAITRGLDKFYADPENRKRFEAWESVRSGKEAPG